MLLLSCGATEGPWIRIGGIPRWVQEVPSAPFLHATRESFWGFKIIFLGLIPFYLDVLSGLPESLDLAHAFPAIWYRWHHLPELFVSFIHSTHSTPFPRISNLHHLGLIGAPWFRSPLVLCPWNIQQRNATNFPSTSNVSHLNSWDSRNLPEVKMSRKRADFRDFWGRTLSSHSGCCLWPSDPQNWTQGRKLLTGEVIFDNSSTRHTNKLKKMSMARASDSGKNQQDSTRIFPSNLYSSADQCGW